MADPRRAAGALCGIGSVSAYVLQHARLPTAVVRKGTVVTNFAMPQPVCSEPYRPIAVALAFKRCCLCFGPALAVFGWHSDHGVLPQARPRPLRLRALMISGCMQVAQQPRRVCMALDDSAPAAHARDWVLSNLVRPDKDELYLISVIILPELEPVRN